MLVELKAKSQVTIPKDIVNSLDLNQGDQFEVMEEDGKIIFVPVAVYPERVIENLKKSVKELKASIEMATNLFLTILILFSKSWTSNEL